MGVPGKKGVGKAIKSQSGWDGAGLKTMADAERKCDCIVAGRDRDVIDRQKRDVSELVGIPRRNTGERPASARTERWRSSSTVRR